MKTKVIRTRPVHEMTNPGGLRRPGWGRTLAAAACAVGLAASCSSGGDGGAPRPSGSGTTVPVEVAQSAFCRDVASFVGVIDRYGKVFTEEQTTVGDLKSAASDLTAARAKVAESSSQLADAITAANRTAGTSGTTTTVLATKTASEHIDAITSAEKDLQAAYAGIDASTTLRSAAADLQMAAFAVEQAYVSLFVDAGCLADDDEAAATLDAYVRGLQEDLATAGFYTGAIDGIYGSQTVTAVKDLQRSAGLPETGVVDPATEAALAKDLAGKAEQQSLNVAALQGALAATGDYAGPIDGVWSPALEEAIVSYQESQQLPATGALDAATLATLLRGGQAGTTTTTAASSSSSATSTSAAPTTSPSTTAPTTTKAP